MKCILLCNKTVSAALMVLLCLATRSSAEAAASKAGQDDEAAKALKTFNTLFGQKMRGVAATASLADDAALASELVKVAKKAKESPALVAIICEKAHWLGARHVSGYDAAIEAMHLLSAVNGEKRADCLEKILMLRQRQYQQAKGSLRGQVGRKLVKELMDAAHCQGEAKQFTKAVGLARRALPIATIHEPDEVANIQKNLTEYTRLSGLERFIGALKSRLAANKEDQAARDQLIRLYVTERDNPAEAVKYLNSSVPADFVANVPLAAKEPDGLDEAACMKLGPWYQELAQEASKTAKIVTLSRAHKYYQRYLSLHEKKDIPRVKAAMSLDKVTKELAALGIKPPVKKIIPWKKALVFAKQDSCLISRGSYSIKELSKHLLKDFRVRTIELWMLPSKYDGVIFDLGAEESGIAMAIIEGHLNLTVRSWAYYTYKKKSESGEVKTVRTDRKVPHGAFLRTLLPSRKNWSHVAVVIDNGRVSLWINGEMKGRSRMSARTIKISYRSSMAIGGGDGTNAGRWPRKGFAGNIALLRVSGKAQYTAKFTPSASPSAEGALAHILADGLNDGRVGRYGFSAGGLSWRPKGEVNVVSAAVASGVPQKPTDPGKTAPGPSKGRNSKPPHQRKN